MPPAQAVSAGDLLGSIEPFPGSENRRGLVRAAQDGGLGVAMRPRDPVSGASDDPAAALAPLRQALRALSPEISRVAAPGWCSQGRQRCRRARQ